MANLIKIDELNDALTGVLEEYREEVTEDLKATTKDAMKELVKTTKGTAPVGHKRSKHYKNSISSKKIHEDSYGLSMVWFVRGSDYRLSHLLNDGHALRDGGRWPGTNFIGDAIDKVVPEYIKATEEKLGNG